MPEYEVVTIFYTLIPWLTGGFIIFGIVAAIALSILLGWWIGSKRANRKIVNFWLIVGWIPIFGIFMASVFTGGTIYVSARDTFSSQIEIVTGIEVVTLIRGNDNAFIGKKGDDLYWCDVIDLPNTDTYKVVCREKGDIDVRKT